RWRPSAARAPSARLVSAGNWRRCTAGELLLSLSQVSPSDPTRSTPDLVAQDRTNRALMALAGGRGGARDGEGFLRATLGHVVQALGLTGGLTFLIDPDGDLLPAAEARLPSPDAEATRELAQRALRDARPVVMEGAGGGWLAAAPLRARERRLGVLTLHDESASSIAPELELLEALGKQIGMGLQDARLYAELRASGSPAQVLNRITATLTSSLELKTVLPAFAREIASLVPFDRLACGFVNDSGDYIEVVAHPEEATWGLGSVLPVVGSG